MPVPSVLDASTQDYSSSESEVTTLAAEFHDKSSRDFKSSANPIALSGSAGAVNWSANSADVFRPGSAAPPTGLWWKNTAPDLRSELVFMDDDSDDDSSSIYEDAEMTILGDCSNDYASILEVNGKINNDDVIIAENKVEFHSIAAFLEEEDSMAGPASFEDYSLSQLEEATHGFSEDSMVGRDDFATIYKIFPLHEFNFAGSQRIHWSNRFLIIQGIAEGVCYLHEQSVVHMDLKPSNIFLDSNKNPKIVSFGLATRLQDAANYITRDDFSGSMGYMSPEYITEGTLSMKYDVYSFGVILLEIISSMCRSDLQPARHQASIEWVRDESGHIQRMDFVIVSSC
ncbi:hypothetical protein PR202_gb13693 [Eleusine coracana subsp. coracana]|uniref:Protein kinase domain-containing protein n=1 Tax=Eleusine coracana subsp. coracana TaxID=191504 RepID=A0AAV5EQZ6_ELECO|nr:hypothetical protein PR202_gb13693 [Eleusine coracana subsp. coracana]